MANMLSAFCLLESREKKKKGRGGKWRLELKTDLHGGRYDTWSFCLNLCLGALA